MKLNKGTLRFICWTGIIILTLLCMEAGSRFLLKSLYESSTSGSKEEYLLRDANEDIIILGNSVGELHIDSQAIEDSLGISCFNGAISSTTMKSHLALLRFLLSHHTPRIIIYAFSENNLIWVHQDPFIDRLKRFYGINYPVVDSLVPTFYPNQKLLLHSSLRRLDRYILTDILHKNGISNSRSLQPKGTRLMPTRHPMAKPHHHKKDTLINQIRLHQLTSFIALCREAGVTLIIAIPPNMIISEGETLCHRELDSIHKARGDFFFWYDPRLTGIKGNPELFLDASHMDKRGARIYTDTIIRRLQDIITTADKR